MAEILANNLDRYLMVICNLYYYMALSHKDGNTKFTNLIGRLKWILTAV